jgi:formate dehydrogenase major subunit
VDEVLINTAVKKPELVKETAKHFIGRGYVTKIGFFGDKSRCESCGECVARCPVGALVAKNILTPSSKPG